LEETMIVNFLRATVIATLAAGALIAPASAQEHPSTKYKINLPPSADLSYAVKAKQSGLSLDGDASVKWNVGGKKFLLVTELRSSLVGKILEVKSDGAIDEYGLAPSSFTEKRFRKDPTTATFNRASKTISFSGSDTTYPIKGGEQDRNSAIWQLISVARGAPAKFKPGSEWKFFVIGQHDADPWTFRVVKQEKIKTPLGDVNAMHLLKVNQADAKGQQVDIWLAPSLEWYPVRLRYTDPDEDFIEQTLVNIVKKPSRANS
jgi:hypothetical protein